MRSLEYLKLGWSLSMSSRVFIATFEDDEDIRLAAIAARREGIEIVDIYAPNAVHGLELPG